jgi:hypothetical protein
VIFDDRAALPDDGDVDDDEDGLAGDVADGEAREWLDGLRAAGLPIRTDVRPAREPSPAVQKLLAESWAPRTRTGYEADWQQFCSRTSGTRSR